MICLIFQEPMKSRAPQLHLEYRFYRTLGNAGESDNKLTISSVGNAHISLITLKLG